MVFSERLAELVGEGEIVHPHAIYLDIINTFYTVSETFLEKIIQIGLGSFLGQNLAKNAIKKGE